MTMDESLLGCRDCYRLRKEYENRELETRRNYTILKQMITSNESVFIKLNQMQRLIDKMHLELSQREKQVADYMQESDSLKKAVDRLELSIKTKTDDMNNLTEKQKIGDAVMQQFQAALKDKEKECEQQKTLIRQLKTQNTKNTKNNKPKIKDNDRDQSKLIISSLLNLALYFAQTLEKRGLLEPKSSTKVKRLFQNPKSVLEVLKSNFNGCSKDLQEIFVITKVDETEHENDSSVEEDNEDGILLQELLTADDNCIAPIASPRTSDKCAMKSPQKTSPRRFSRNSPQKTPPRKINRNSPPEKLIRDSPPEKLIQTLPPEKLIRNSSPPRESSPFKMPSQILTQGLPTKNSLQASCSNGFHLESPTKNFDRKSPLQTLSWKSPTNNSVTKNSLAEERDEALEVKKNTTPRKIPLAENTSCVRKLEPICNGNTTASLLNGAQRFLKMDCTLNQINVRKRRHDDEEKVTAKIKEIFSAMILRERPISPLPKKSKKSFENSVNAENCLPELEPSKPEIQIKRSAFISNLKPRCSNRIRPVTKVYCSNTETKLEDEIKVQVCETSTCPPRTTEDNLSQLSEKETSVALMDGDNSEQLDGIVVNFENNENVLDSKAAQDCSAMLGIEETSKLEDSLEVKDSFSGADSPKPSCSVPSESSQMEDLETTTFSPSKLKDNELLAVDKIAAESNETLEIPLDLSLAKSTVELSGASDFKGNNDSSILQEDCQMSVENNISNLAESGGCSHNEITKNDNSTATENLELNCNSNCQIDIEQLRYEFPNCSSPEILTDTMETLNELCNAACADNEPISMLDFQKQPESESAVSNNRQETTDIVRQPDVAVLVAEEENQPDRSSAMLDNVQASNGLSCKQTDNSCLPIVVDFKDDTSLLASPDCDNLVIDETVERTPASLFSSPDCRNLVIDETVERTTPASLLRSPDRRKLLIDERIERTPKGSSPTLESEIESPESPTAEIPMCFDIPEIPLSPPHPRYWTRSRTSENNSKPSPDINSSQNNCLGKDVTNIGNKDALPRNGSPNDVAVSPVLAPISPLPTTPDRINETKFARDLSRECVEPRPLVRRQIALNSSPEKFNGNGNEDSVICPTEVKKRKFEDNGMDIRKKPKRTVKDKQSAISNVKSERRMCTRLSTRNENERVKETKSKQAQEVNRNQVQDKKNKKQSRNKSRARREKFRDKIEISAAEKCPLLIPMHLILLIKNVINELKECREDLTAKICDSTRNRKVSVVTDGEKILLERIKEKTKRINPIVKKRAFDTLDESLNAAIFTDSSIHTFGRASLCRFYCAICKYLGNLNRVRELCYNLLLKMTDVAGFFIINVLDEVPASGQFYEVIQYVLVNCDVGLTSSMKTYITSMFSEVCCTKDCDVYVTDLLFKLRRSNEVLVSEIEWSVEIIAAVKGWSWAKENLILKYLWPTITEWGQTAKKSKKDNRNNSHLSDTFVASIFKIFGPVCQKCPSAESHMVIDFMKELRLLLRTVNLNLVTSLVQEGVVEAIINLEKFRPDIPRLVLQFWLSTTKHVISPHLQTMIDRVAKKMNVESAELVEGWT